VLTLDVKSHGVCSHDDDLLLMRFALPSRNRAAPSRTPRRGRRRFLFLVLLVPLMSGAVIAPTSRVAGDDLSDAIAKQKAIEKQVARQKSQIAELNALQREVAGEIARTARALSGINADIGTVRKGIGTMVARINVVRGKYDALVAQLAVLDAQLVKVEADEAAKRVELGERRELLADRLRNAYDTDRTSLLETFLSGASFTDVLTQVSYYLDVSEQDKALAELIMRDQETLASLHQTVADTRASTDDLRLQTAAQKLGLDGQLNSLKQAQAALRQLQLRTIRVLAAQKAVFARASKNKAALQKSIARAAAAQRALAGRIDAIVRQQASNGRIPSSYNGALRWPMGGTVSQNFGCTGMSWEPPLGDCAHFHQGIDIVASYGTAVHASGAGRVAYIGWNWADGADPAWIVIIAHAGDLETWYAHMQPRYPVSNGEWVNAGQVIGYEGNTGHSTGAHLHWAVRHNGYFKNPRLFL
jgi:murein DD-endopeptidase MepM/ murein hydrolase activator NlpD